MNNITGEKMTTVKQDNIDGQHRNRTNRKKHKPKPEWLKVKIPTGHNYFKIKKTLEEKKLFTICQSARCPNISECWNHNHATFLIMGNVCTRNCLFCSVDNGTPEAINPEEPDNILKMVDFMELKYAVITSVTRDDLEDQGSSHFARVISTLKTNNPSLKIEVLIPDFKGNQKLATKIIEARPDVISHNLETVKRIYPIINRKLENYHISLNILKFLKKKHRIIKSGIMIGLGETVKEILDLFNDLRNAGVELLTIGQYLQPTVNHIKVEKFYTQQEFRHLKRMATRMGFKAVESGPFVRSSYHAGLMYDKISETMIKS